MTTHTRTTTRRISEAGVTLRRTVTSELIKLTTLRSQVWLLIVAATLVATLGPIQTLGQVMAGPGDTMSASAAVSLALTGMSTSTLLVGVLGVLVVTGEYAPRAIRTTFTLVPRRGHVVVAKALAIALVTTMVGILTVAIAVTASLAILSSAGSSVSWGSPDVLRISAVMVWYLVGWAVLGLAAGWLTRSKLGGAALLLGLMLLLAPVLGLVPGRPGEVLVALMPSSAGAAMVGTEPGGTLSSPGTGFVIWTAYLVLSTVLSAWLTAHRDV